MRLLVLLEVFPFFLRENRDSDSEAGSRLLRRVAGDAIFPLLLRDVQSSREMLGLTVDTISACSSRGFWTYFSQFPRVGVLGC